MAINLFSSDNGTNRIYKHDGFSTTILDSFSSPYLTPRGLAFDGSNVLSGDDYGTTNRIYKHDGFSAVILDSFSSPAGTPIGLAWDGTNVYSSDYGAGKIYKHVGFSAAISDSFGNANSASHLVWHGGDIYTILGFNLVKKRNGFSSTILDSFSSPAPYPTAGIACDGSDFYICCYGSTDKIFRLDGFSAVILDSFSSPAGYPEGIAFETTGC